MKLVDGDNEDETKARCHPMFRVLRANNPRHRIAALWREGMNVKGRGWAARGAREC